MSNAIRKTILVFLLVCATLSLACFTACGSKQDNSTSSSSSQQGSGQPSGDDSSSSSEKDMFTLNFVSSGVTYEIIGEDSKREEESVTIEVEEGGVIIDLSKYVSEKTGAEFLGWRKEDSNRFITQYFAYPSNESGSVYAVFANEPMKIGARNYVYWGKYPQDRLKDEDLIAEFDKDVDEYGVPKDKHYHNGKTYVRKGVDYSLRNEKFADGEAIEVAKGYYFELKPLLWSLSGDPETEIVTASTDGIVIDAVVYDDSDGFDDYTKTDFYEFAHSDFLYNTNYFTGEEMSLSEPFVEGFVYSINVKAPSGTGYTERKYTDYAVLKGVPRSAKGAIYWLHNDASAINGNVNVSSGGKWNGKAKCDEIMGFSPNVRLDLRKTYTMTFETNGGNKVEDLIAKAGESLPTATREHYDFDGWYIDAKLTEKVETVPTMNSKLYAKWTAKTYNITYAVDGGARNAENNPSTYTVDGDVALLQPIVGDYSTVNYYYTFVGWCKDKALTKIVTNVSEIGGGNAELTAKWVPTEYKITYELDGGTNSENNPATISYVSERVTLEAPTKESCDFEGWYLDAEFTEKITTLKPFEKPFKEYRGDGIVVGDVTLYAKFEAYVGGIEGDVVYRIKGDEVKIVALADKTKTSAVIPATVDGKAEYIIDAKIFEGATALTDITFECSDALVETLTSDHFAGLTNLNNIVATSSAITKIVKKLPNKTLNTWTVTEEVFKGCDLWGCTVEKIVLADSVTDINAGAFNQLDNVKELYVGKNATCSNGKVTTNYDTLALKTLTVHTTDFLRKFTSTDNYNNVENFVILGGAFDNAPKNVEKITLGKDVTVDTSTNPYSFLNDTKSLKEIVVEDGNTVFSQTDDGSIVYNGNTLLFLKSATIPSDVTEISSYAVAASTITILDIPEGVTKIGDYAFKNSTSIIEVSLPASLKTLGQSFSTSVKTLNVACELDFSSYTPMKSDGGVETLNVTAKSVIKFSSWKGLKTANLLNVETVAEEAFSNCSSLETVNMPALKTGAKFVFKNCQKLKEVTLGEYLTEIPEYMFSVESSQNALKALETVNLEHVEIIGSYAFKGCEKLTVSLGDSITSIGFCAFKGCKEWDGVLGNNVKKIGSEAFVNCSITGELNLPESVTEIGEGAFGYSKSGNAITAIRFAGTIAQWEKIVNGGFVDHAVEYYFNNEKVTSYTFSGDVPNNVFAYNQSLTSVDLTSATEIGNSAFKGCANLETVIGMTNIKKIGVYAFSDCAKFKGDNGVLNLNEGLTHLYQYAFSGCSGITEVTIPESVIYLGGNVFKGCSVNKLWISSSITNTQKEYYVGLQAETITIKVKKNYSSSNIAFESGLYELTANVKTLKLTGTPQVGVKGSEGKLKSAVSGISTLETLILDEGIIGIESYCLNDLTNLKTLVIKAKVTNFQCNTYTSFQNFPSTLENLYCDVAFIDTVNKPITPINATHKYSASEWKGL